MVFDVIVGNPPYQLNDGGGNGASALPIYQLFMMQAFRLAPRYVTMIVPARWYSGGKGLDAFRDALLHDDRLRVLHDFAEAVDCFPGRVQLKGGVCYFLWDRSHRGDCLVTNHRLGESAALRRPLLEPGLSTFIRYNAAIPILHKVRAVDGGARSFMALVSPRRPFGLDATYHGFTVPTADDDVLLFRAHGVRYCPRAELTRNLAAVDLHKVFIAKAGSGSDRFPHSILGEPFYAGPGTACTETYLMLGPFDSRERCANVASYVQTRFFRFLVHLKKNTQNAARDVYELVPQLDFGRPWTDADLAARYGLSKDESAFIDSLIRPMTGE